MNEIIDFRESSARTSYWNIIKIWQGSSAGESARLIPVRSRVRISPLLFFIAFSRVIRSTRVLLENNNRVRFQVFTSPSCSARLPLRKTYPLGVTFSSAQSDEVESSNLSLAIFYCFLTGYSQCASSLREQQSGSVPSFHPSLFVI